MLFILFILWTLCVRLVDSKLPNILLVVADDYGWNDIGYHGSEIKTPNLDKLAGEGVKLESYYVQPVCTPTRSQLMTGRYQIHTGLQHKTIRPMVASALPSKFPTLANKLKEAGYSTHMIGKWHLGHYKKEFLPTSRGFDTFYGFWTDNEDYFTHRRVENYTVNGTAMAASGLDLRDNLKPVLTENGTYSAGMFARRAAEIVQEHASTKPNTPLFMYLPFQSVHEPLQVPESYMQPYKFIQNKDRRTYAGMVAAMDEAIGNVTSAFVRNGLWDDTLMIFTTDNGGPIYQGGGANNWPLKGGKTHLWEGGIRGVGFVRGNLLNKPGTQTMELMHVSDWFPTLMTVVGTSTKGMNLDGMDMWKTISQGAPSPRKELLHNIDPLTTHGQPMFNGTFKTNVRAAIRVGDWKLLTGDPGIRGNKHVPVPKLDSLPVNDVMNEPAYKTAFNFDSKIIYSSEYPGNVQSSVTYSNKNVWLYNIKQDPYEYNDLSDAQPAIVLQLLDRLAYYNSTAVPCVFPDPDPRADPALHGDVWGPWE